MSIVFCKSHELFFFFFVVVFASHPVPDPVPSLQCGNAQCFGGPVNVGHPNANAR